MAVHLKPVRKSPILVGVPREIKTEEHRVGMTPEAVGALVRAGHDAIVETGAAHRIGIDDADYIAAGARIAADAREVFAGVDMIVKVKEPQPAEFGLLREGQILFTFLHLAPDPAQTQALIDCGCTAIAYETVTDDFGGLPLLAPMSEVAGRMAVQAGAHCLETEHGGRGVLLGGVPGVRPGKVAIIGGGVVGANAALVASGLGASITVLDTSLRRLAELDLLFHSRIATRHSTPDAIEQEVLEADLVVGAVLIPGAAAPRLVTREMVRLMKRGSVIVDVAIDQGGCCETSRPTTHSDPSYTIDGVVHYCVANMPSAVARTSTFALNNATLPFIRRLAALGCRDALLQDPHLLAGLNVHRGRLVCRAVAEAQDRDYISAREALAV